MEIKKEEALETPSNSATEIFSRMEILTIKNETSMNLVSKLNSTVIVPKKVLEFFGFE